MGYSHPNESIWRWGSDGAVELISESGKVTVRLETSDGLSWRGAATGTRWPLTLNAVLTATDIPTGAPSIVVNSIPKSGTYFLDAALNDVGFSSSRFHLSGIHTVDDYRNAPETTMHKNPQIYRTQMPIDLVPCITSRQTIAAHCEYPEIIQRMRDRGHLVLHVVRNLRDVLISLYQFKLNVVEPLDVLDHSWRRISEPNRFIAFMFHFAEKDLKHILKLAQNFSTEPQLRYEDLFVGHIPRPIKRILDRFERGLSLKLTKSVLAVHGKSTPTLSPKRSVWQDHWTDDIELMFNALGLADANRALGYA